MATLKLPAGKQYVPRKAERQIIVAPVRSGHAAASTYYDQFRKRQGSLTAKQGSAPQSPMRGSIPAPDSIKRRNTPLGAHRSAWEVLRNDNNEQFNKIFGPPVSNVELAERMLPTDVIRQTAANIVRKDLGLRPEKVARQYPVVHDTRLKPVRERARTPYIERGSTPLQKDAFRLLAKLKREGLL